MDIKRAYRFRFNPTPEQEVILARTFGCARFAYNHVTVSSSCFTGFLGFFYRYTTWVKALNIHNNPSIITHHDSSPSGNRSAYRAGLNFPILFIVFCL